MTEQPPPGWYPDPTDQGARRWFDGEKWTDHVQTSAPPEGAAPAPETSAAITELPPTAAADDALEQSPTVAGDPAPPRTSRRFVLIGLGIAVVLAGAWLFATLAGQPTPLEAAYDSCRVDGSVGATIRDNGRTLVLDHKGEEDLTGLTIIEVVCHLDAIDTPSSVTARMDQTTSMAGQQSATFNGITAWWTYHPDRGLDIILEMDR